MGDSLVKTDNRADGGATHVLRKRLRLNRFETRLLSCVMDGCSACIVMRVGVCL